MAQQPIFDIVTTVPDGGASLAAGGVLTFQYPLNRSSSTYWGQHPARMNVRAMQANFVQDADFTVVYGAASIKVTYTGASTIPANAVCSLQIPTLDTADEFDLTTSTGLVADSQYVTKQESTPEKYFHQFKNPTTPVGL